MTLEKTDIEKMESEELARLEAHEAKKGLERAKLMSRVQAHQKLVARTTAKQLLSQMKPFTYKYLLDTSFFHDVRVEVKLKCDVMPWILDQAEELVKTRKANAAYIPDMALATSISDAAQTHKDKVAEHKNRIEKAKLSAENEEKSRIANKLRRKQEKEA